MKQYETQPAWILPNVQINLTNTKSFSNDSKLLDTSTASKTSKDASEQRKLTILEKLRLKHGFTKTREGAGSERAKPYSEIQWKSFNLIKTASINNTIDSERIGTSKPYRTPIINTFGGSRSKKTTVSITNKKQNVNLGKEPKKAAMGRIKLDLLRVNKKPGHCKGKLSKQFEKTNIYSLLKS